MGGFLGELFAGLLQGAVDGVIKNDQDVVDFVRRKVAERDDAQARMEAELAKSKAEALSVAAKLPEGPPSPATAPDPAMSPKRQLCYRYLALPYLAQIQLAQALDLLRNEDRGIDDAALFGRIYGRATERGMLAELTAAVEAAHAPEGAGG